MNAIRSKSGINSAILNQLADDTSPPSPTSFSGWVRMQPPKSTSPPPMTFKDYQELSPQEKDSYNKERLNSHGHITTLLTPQMKKARQAMAAAVESVATNHSPVANRGLFLTGPAQAGKSTILLSFAQDLEKDLRQRNGLSVTDPNYPPRDAHGDLYVPIAYALCSSFIGNTLSNILGFYGEQGESTRNADKIERVAFLIETNKTRVLLLDQAQELGSTRTKMADQSEFLKTLLDNNLGLTILGAGISLHTLSLFQSGGPPQLEQTAHRFQLHEVDSYPVSRPEDVAPFLTAIEKRLTLLKQRPGALARLAPDVLTLTNGVTGRIVNLIRDAAQFAITSGDERITQTTLRQVVTKPIIGSRAVA